MSCKQVNARLAEEKAIKFLTESGFIVIDVNAKGEQFYPFDLIATKDDITYAINVKSLTYIPEGALSVSSKNMRLLHAWCKTFNTTAAYLFVFGDNFAFFEQNEQYSKLSELPLQKGVFPLNPIESVISPEKNAIVKILKMRNGELKTTIPARIWNTLELQEGDWIDLSISLNRRGNEKPEEKP